jgi:hypothetical protein
VVPAVAPAVAAFAAAGLLLVVVAFHCFLSPPLGDGGGGGARVVRRPNPPFLVRSLRFLRPFTNGQIVLVADSVLLPRLTRVPVLLFPPFCFSEQLNKPAEVARSVIGAVDFAVPVSEEFRVWFMNPFKVAGGN